MSAESFEEFKRKMSSGEPVDPDSLSIGDMDGSAATMRPANKILERLHVIDLKGEVVTLIYAFLDVRAEYKPGRFVVTFAGTKHFRLTVEGNNLWRMFDYITQRRWSYIRVSPRSFEDKEMVITAVDIADITPKSE